jgi:hypothetical protein
MYTKTHEDEQPKVHLGCVGPRYLAGNFRWERCEIQHLRTLHIETLYTLLYCWPRWVVYVAHMKSEKCVQILGRKCQGSNLLEVF